MNTSIKITLLIIVLASAEHYGDNQMSNGNFQQPPLGNGVKYRGGGNITGWTCKNYCARVKCSSYIREQTKNNTLFPHCSGIAIQLDARFSKGGIIQAVSLSTGTYLLSFDYYYPQTKANTAVLTAYFNDQLLLTVRPNVQTTIEGFKYQGMVEAIQGDNSLSIFNTKKVPALAGFLVNNISFRRILDQTFQRSVSNFFQLQFLTTSVSFPGGRVFFGSLMSFLINLDRYELYSYHNRNYSYHAQKIMDSLGQLQNKKGKLFSNVVDSVLGKYTKFIKEQMEKVNLKKKYYKYGPINKQQKQDNLNPFLSQFFAYSLPIILFLYIIFHILFQLLKKWSISKLLRQFAFHATLIFIMVEGNIQALTFHGFGQLKHLFSFNYGHKIFNILALIILFFVTFICFGLYLLLKISYNRKAKLILESQDSSLKSLMAVNFDRGIIIFLLGLTHQLLLKQHTLQLSLLIILQFIWIIKRFFNKQLFKKTVLFIMMFLESFLRIFFQSTCLAYTLSSEEVRVSINSRQHKILFYLLIVFIITQIIFLFALALVKWYRKIKTNKGRVQQQEQIVIPGISRNSIKTGKNKRESTKLIQKLCILKAKQRRDLAQMPIKKYLKNKMKRYLNISRLFAK